MIAIHRLAFLLGTAFAGLAGAQPSAPTESPPAFLTNAAQLRALSPADTARKLPLKLQGVVTVNDPGRTIFLQDATGGTFINGARREATNAAPGDWLEVEGTTYSGLFVPGITPVNVRPLGQRPLPAPVPVTFDDLLSTRWHYQRVEITGVVRSMLSQPARERPGFVLAMGGRKLEVHAVIAGVSNLPPMIDARVRISGLAAGYINDKRQLIAPNLLVSRLDDIHVEAAGNPDPTSLPLTTLDGLLRFNPAGVSDRRIRVRGVVTHQQPGEALYLRNAGRGLLVQTARGEVVRPGDVVEAAGFPAMGRFSAFLEDAEYRVVGREPEPLPLPTTVSEVLKGTNDVDLVTLSAQLLEVLETPQETVLVLRAGNTAFRAHLPRTTLPLRNGSQVRLTGVCRVEESSFPGAGFRANPRTIDLLLRTPADVAIVSAPSWWTTQRLSYAAAGLLALMVVALAWIVLLRRRVAEQTAVIRQKVQREAALEERHRMAREMHDTLAQSFSGLGFQLNALDAKLPADAPGARQQLETARQMVRHGQEEFRRSLMNLRAQELERGGLADALPDLARQIIAGTGIELHCDIQPPPSTLPEAVEGNLLRIAQECLTNAVRHGQPGKIDLSLAAVDGKLRLRVADNGSGFDPRQLNQQNGHFGWRGIRERAEQIQAQVDLDARPGGGTAVCITVPL